MRRAFTTTVTVFVVMGSLLWFSLLLATGANIAIFSRNYTLLLLLNVGLALLMFGLVGWQLHNLWRDYRSRVFGAKLKLRLMLMFGVIALLPGILVYGVSVQFLTRSIETWFDVRIEKALESGVQLGRSVLDSLLADLAQKGRGMAEELTSINEVGRRSALLRLSEERGIAAAAIFSLGGQLIVSASTEGLSEEKTQGREWNPLTSLPSVSDLRQARSARLLTSVEGVNDKLFLRVLLPVNSLSAFDEPRILQIIQPVPPILAKDADAVENVHRDYQELQLARVGLTRIYALTLTLTVLVALFSAFLLAYTMARRLLAPILILAAGTKAVAEGDFSPKETLYSDDELGVLTRSFNRMTSQLDDARRETEKNRFEVESAHAYLETVLANLSAGVLVFDRQFILRTVNAGARQILSDDFQHLIHAPIDRWHRQHLLGEFIREQFALHEKNALPDAPPWQAQFEIDRVGLLPQVLLLRGSHLPEGHGDVVVFDDVTRVVAAQRSAAWGEVARRLAHEIKNPLTPIQLSAERLQQKLVNKLDENDAQMLSRGTQTIINQVQAMKHMVDDFRDYAKIPKPEFSPVDLNALIIELLVLYESANATFMTELTENLPTVRGDATQLRQVIHNLLRNAEDALEGKDDGRIQISTQSQQKHLCLCIKDNGSGFPPELFARIFEPYVTTKTRGTGLGLPIVKKIVEEHDGNISIANAPEGGACIHIYLPFWQE